MRISTGLFQPIAAEDVAAFVADVALAEPANGIVEIAGPERAPFNEIIARYLKAVGDPREVVGDTEARYFGGLVDERSLVPLGEARLGPTRFEDWLKRSSTSRLGDVDHEGHSAGPASCLPVIHCCPGAREPGGDRHTTCREGAPGVQGQGRRDDLGRVSPGASDPIHRHNAHAFVYVLEGSIVMQLRDAAEVTLSPGQTYYEGPNDVHIVGRNASNTRPAKFVVFLVKNQGAPILEPS